MNEEQKDSSGPTEETAPTPASNNEGQGPSQDVRTKEVQLSEGLRKGMDILDAAPAPADEPVPGLDSPENEPGMSAEPASPDD